MAARNIARAGVVAAGALAAAGCAQRPVSQAIVPVSHVNPVERDCLARAMYFESHRGSDDGMLAVGTVVANRLKSGQYGTTYCEVVGQKRQFATGVLSRPMDDGGAERARRVADAVIAGKRHAGVHDAMHFHTAGLRFPYPNMRYVLVAGGNAFYEKRGVETAADIRENTRSRAMALAYAKADPTAPAKPIMVASLDPRPIAPAAAMAPVAIARSANAGVATTASVVMSRGALVAPAPVVAAPKATVMQLAVAPPPTAATPVAIEAAPAVEVVGEHVVRAPATASKAVRTIATDATPVLASTTPAASRPAARTAPPAPVVAFAHEQTQPVFPSSLGPRMTSDNSPVAQAWASFQ